MGCPEAPHLHRPSLCLPLPPLFHSPTSHDSLDMLFPLLVVSASVFIAGSLHGAAAQEIPQPPRNGFLRLLSQEEMECHAIFGSQPRELVVVNGVVKDGE